MPNILSYRVSKFTFFMGFKPLVSAIITTKNSAATILDLLNSLKSQSYKDLEVILVDNNSSDKTVEIAKGFTNKVFQKGPERSVQRNFGVKKAKGDYFFFLDSDMELTKNVVKECVEKIKDSSIGGVVVPEKSHGEGFWAKTKALERKINEGEAYFEAARFFPRKAFVAIGGFDETLTGPEDWDLPQNVAKKYKIARIKSYILHNEGRPSLLGLAKRKYYYGLSVHKYLKKQKMSIISSKTIYFLRPSFYKKFYLLAKDPMISLGMVAMLLIETVGGGLGYIMGRIKNE